MKDQYIEVAGCRTRFRDSGGTGVVTLFIGGIGASLETWTAQEVLAGADLRVVTVDLPGHGLSAMGDQPYDPEKFAVFGWQFLDAIGVREAVLVGNSMGGGVAILMAAVQPQRALKLLIADAATMGRFSPMPFRLMTLPGLGALMTKPSKAGVEQQLKALFYDPATVTDEIRAIVTRNVMSEGRQKAFRSTLCLMTDIGGQRQSVIDRTFAALRSLAMPIVFLHGRQDAVLPLQHSVEAQKMTKNARLVVLENCGHTPQIEKPTEFNAELIQLLSA
jgi:pimeloyl-ACP methyl ester carboxylesterase